MADEVQVQNAPAAAAAEQVPENEKEAIYIQIGQVVMDKTGKRIGKSGGRELFDLVVERVFAAAAKDGTFRFNGGFGAFHTKKYGSGSRRLPSGQQTTFGERHKIRYEEGVVVKELVRNGGDLQAAISVARGTRQPKASKTKSKATKPAAPAKQTTAAAKPGAEGDVDLS